MGIKQAESVRNRSRAPHRLQVGVRLRHEGHFSALEAQAGATTATKPPPTGTECIGASAWTRWRTLRRAISSTTAACFVGLDASSLNPQHTPACRNADQQQRHSQERDREAGCVGNEADRSRTGQDTGIAKCGDRRCRGASRTGNRSAAVWSPYAAPLIWVVIIAACFVQRIPVEFSNTAPISRNVGAFVLPLP